MTATIYRGLRELARRRLAVQRPDHTLQPTALVNEAWLKLRGAADHAEGSPAFFRTAAEAMRQVLVDHARGKRRLKRGGGAARPEGDVADLAGPPAADGDAAEFDEVLALDDAMGRLRALDPQAAEVVTLKFFGGLTVEEIAAVLGVSERTVKRDWQFARAWLAKELSLESISESQSPSSTI